MRSKTFTVTVRHITKNDGSVIKFKRPVELVVHYHQFKINYQIYTYYIKGIADISAMAKKRKTLLEDINEFLSSLYDSFVACPKEELHYSAIKLRHRLMAKMGMRR